MENFEIIKKLFGNLKCSKCDNFFIGDAVQLVRQEENNVVVRITCSYCGKNLGLAILGLDGGEYKNSLNFQDAEGNEPDSFCFAEENEFLNTDIPDPITYNEVVEAHKFFSGLGSDWVKYLPKQD